MNLRIRSIRAKLVLIVAGVALLVGAVSAIYSSYTSGQVLERELVKRGKYIANNLAHNSQFGVMTEDKLLLNSLIDSAMTAGRKRAATDDEADVTAVAIRDAKGGVLAQKGPKIREVSGTPVAEGEPVPTATESGESVLLFRFP